MSQFLIPFDPSATASGNLITNLGQDAGVLLVLNDSAANVTLQFSDGSTRFLPAQSWRRVDLPAGNPVVAWTRQATLPFSVPVSQVYAESFTTGEEIPEVFPASLVRGVIGSMSIASEVSNTGNSPGTPIVVSNSSPGAGSWALNNDGSGTEHLLDAGNFVSVINLVNGTNIAAALAAFGTPTDLTMTTFNGVGNFGNTTIGALVSAGGIATIGHWVSVFHATRKHITTNGLQNICGGAAPLTGLYRVNGYIQKSNATASALTLQATWEDPDDSTAHGQAFAVDVGGTYTALRGVATFTATVLPCFPFTFAALTGQNVLIQYNDPSGTPNDNVSADIEVFVI